MGLTEDISKYLTGDQLAEFGPGVVDNSTIAGIMAYYPLALQPLAMLYRIDRFEEAGLSIPVTWDEFLAVAQALTTGDNEKGFSMVGSNNSSGQGRFMAYLWSTGLDIVYEEDGVWKTDINTPEFFDAFTFWTDMNNVHKVVPEGITEVTYPVAANYFAMGFTSTMMSGGNAMGVAYSATPELKGKIGTFPIPGPKPGSMMNTEGYGLSVYATEEEKKAAIEFCNFFANGDPDMLYWQVSGKMPATVVGLTVEHLQGADYAGFLQTIENGTRPVCNFPGMGAMKGLLSDAYSAVFAGEKTNEQAVETLYTNMVELLLDYN